MHYVMAPHSSILAWKIPWTEEPGGATVHGVPKSRTWLSDFTFTFHFHALEKEMATHSRVLAWRSPGLGEPGGLLSMGSHRVGHDWSDLLVVVVVVRLKNSVGSCRIASWQQRITKLTNVSNRMSLGVNPFLSTDRHLTCIQNFEYKCIKDYRSIGHLGIYVESQNSWKTLGPLIAFLFSICSSLVLSCCGNVLFEQPITL